MTPSSLPSPESEKKSSLPSRGAVPHLPDGVTVGANQEIECKKCGRTGVRDDIGRLPLGWRTLNTLRVQGPVCPMCWEPVT